MLAARRNPARPVRLIRMSFIIWRAGSSHGGPGPEVAGGAAPRTAQRPGLEMPLQPLSPLLFFRFFFFFLFGFVLVFFFSLDRWRKKAPSFWGGQREEHIPLCPLPTALSSPKTRTRRQPGHRRQEPGEERSSPSTVEKQNCGYFLRLAQLYWAISSLIYHHNSPLPGREPGVAEGLVNNARPPRFVLLSAEKRCTQETGRGETQPRTKDSPLGLDVQPLQSFRAELVSPPPRADPAVTQLPWGSLMSLTTSGPSH